MVKQGSGNETGLTICLSNGLVGRLAQHAAPAVHVLALPLAKRFPVLTFPQPCSIGGPQGQEHHQADDFDGVPFIEGQGHCG